MSKSALQEYCEKVTSGKIVACGKVKSLCARLLNDVKNPYKQWHFDEDYANRPIEFIETFCKIPSGRLGQPFILELYEKAWLQAIFGFVDEAGLRRYQETFIVVARKNGKTSLAAALELYMLIADGEGAPQIYNVATSFEQANLAFQAALRMYQQSGALQAAAKKRKDDVYCPRNFGYIKPMSSNTGTLDGLDVHMAVLDEMAAMRNRDLYDLIKQGTAAREQPLIFTITTNGFVRGNIFDAQMDYARGVLDGSIVDDTFLPWIYELDDRDEWTDEKCWIKSNPGLGTVKPVAKLKGYVAKAKNDPAFLPTVMTKDFNMPENSAIAWLSFDEAVNEETIEYPEKWSDIGLRYGIAGFDASDTVDLSAAHVLMMRPDDDHIYERSMYWIPEDAIAAYADQGDRRERDSVPYMQWIARGLLRTVPGNKIDKRVFLDWLVELREEHDLYTYACGFDPWHMDDSTLRDLESFVGKGRCIKVRQGAITLSAPMKQIRADYQAHRIIDNHHPINEWCRMNVSIKADVNGNIQPVKKLDNPHNRIDGFAAEIDAYVVLCNLMEDYQQVI